MKLYSIQKKECYPGSQFRFRSKFNNCLGNWCTDKESAVREGEDHQLILLKIYPDLFSLKPEED